MTFGWELVILHTRPSMFGKFLVDAWRWCRGLNKEHLHQFIEGQTHFDVVVFKTSLALNELKLAGLHSISNTTCDLAPQVGSNHLCYMQNNQWRSIGEYRGLTLTKSPIELKDNSIGYWQHQGIIGSREGCLLTIKTRWCVMICIL